jgi:hypothetical protein
MDRELGDDRSWSPFSEILTEEPRFPASHKDLHKDLDTQSAGINRHEVENERILQERSSEPS